MLILSNIIDFLKHRGNYHCFYLHVITNEIKSLKVIRPQGKHNQLKMALDTLIR